MTEQLTRIERHRFSNQASKTTRNRRFLVIGGNVVDEYRNNENQLLKSFPGGNGVNVAGAIRRLGEPTTLITPAPDKLIVSFASERGFDIDALRPEKGSGTPKRVTYFNSSPTWKEAPKRDYKIDFSNYDYDALVLSSVDSNSWKDIYQAGTNSAKPTAGETKFLAILPGSTLIKNATLPEATFALQKSDLICLNRKELVDLLNNRGREVNSATPLLKLISIAANEFGKEKYIAVTDETESVLHTKDSRVLSLPRFGELSEHYVGAGDAYAGALIASLVNNLTPEEAIVNAALNAFGATRFESAQEGHQTAAELAELKTANPDYKPKQIFPAE